ncbi:ribosomal RNA-processing protein 8 isoform X3 [Rhododendron vialii]|uniref:ribosomal RNA-processing protein 8 isoform X3 n=1 Tax=Rhododendron vialii TaxID=182163 RepID=UPI00265DA02F|nr:ribosomal RNA-processing protein 8 isoform X3 [Rhododendron vialii]
MEEERSNRKRKRPRRRNNRAEKSSNNPKHRDQVVNKIDGDEGGDDSGPSGAPPAAANRRVSSAFLDKMRAKLSGGHFRMINEKLYTCTGSEALDYFKEDPTLFNVTPLDTSSIDVAVFCLSLMGTNFASYLREAHRVLKKSGWLLIAEVKSRFDPNNGGADPDRFSKAICDLGFASVSKDFSNKMFILLYFKKKVSCISFCQQDSVVQVPIKMNFFSKQEKQNSKNGEIVWPELKPCLYKRR